MSDPERLLERIEEGVVEHGGDLGGWTRRSDDALQLFDGRVTLTIKLEDRAQPDEGMVQAHVHVHVLTTLPSMTKKFSTPVCTVLEMTAKPHLLKLP